MTTGARAALLAMLLRAALLLQPMGALAGYTPVDPAQIQDILSRMTLREKLETTGITTLAETDLFDLKYNPLDIVRTLPSPHAESWFDLKDHERLGLRGMRTRDGPRGVTCLLGGNMPFGAPCPKDGSTPSFPHGNLRAASWDTSLEEEFGVATGEIAKILDVHAALLPCINILPWLNGGRSQESYGEDPLLNGKMGAATVRGVQSKGVMATPKHFLANNIENTRWMVSAEMDDKTLHEVYLKKWAIVVAEGSPEFIMTSYNRVQGNWSNIDPKFIRLLREKLGFQGSVMTDWLAIMTFGPKMVRGTPFMGRSDFFGDVNTALIAGVDMEMPFNSRHIQAVRHLAACSDADAQTCTTANMLDRAVAHLLRSKIRYGLVNAPKPSKKLATYDTYKYDALSLKIAQRGMVLLRNEGDFLPKRPADVKSVAVLGTAWFLELGDFGSSAQKPAGRYISVLEGLNETYGSSKVSWVRFDSMGLSEVERAVRSADLVVVDVGLNHTNEGEFIPPGSGGDRPDLNLPAHLQNLVLICASWSSNVVVVLTSGANIVVEEFVDKVKAIIWMGYPGAMGGQALADILAGDVNPSGRMPSATPKKPEDWVPEGITTVPFEGSEVQYPYAHGFKHMWGAQITPRYPMGWGLSYTTFSFGKPTVSAKSSKATLEPVVSVEVTNTGKRSGIETVQVYATCADCKKKRLPILLVGFGKVDLEAGEKKSVSVTVSAKEFAVYDEPAGMWLLEKGTYTLLVGPHADAKALQGVDFTVEKDVVFDYAGATTPPHVPGVGERDCSPKAYSCHPDAVFNAEESSKTLQARLVTAAILALVLSLLCGCCVCLRKCARRCCGKKAAKKDKES